VSRPPDRKIRTKRRVRAPRKARGRTTAPSSTGAPMAAGARIFRLTRGRFEETAVADLPRRIRPAALGALAQRKKERDADTARWALALQEVSGGHDRQLRWLLEFATRDLGALSAEEWRDLLDQIAFVLNRGPMGAGLPPGANQHHVGEAQRELGDFFKALARGQLYETRPVEGAWVFARVEGDPREERPLHRAFSGPLPAQLVLTAAALLDRAGPDRLRWCPFKPTGAGSPCGALFLAERRQKFCCREHAGKAAWRAYWQRIGGTRAKR
jgi:hypothetical protein